MEEIYTPQINVYHLLEGAKQATGLVVIIDVFRAFSLECYIAAQNPARLMPVQSIDEAFALKRILPESILIGERHGKKCIGFDFGNSPSQIRTYNLKDKTVIHTTSIL